jgi:BlaI family transcriptional regulator, penicillinase repressor
MFAVDFYFTVMQLTKAEEQIMQILWDLGEGMVRDIRDRFDEPKPARNTVSTIIRVLEAKGVVSYRAEGNTHVYIPLVSKKDYSKKQLFSLMKNYFDNSFPQMATFFAREKDLTIDDLEELMNETKEELKNPENK